MKLNNVDFNKLAVFCEIVNSGNYQRASETLNVTPSALSQTIKSLEESLAFLLFERVGKKLIPTQRGLLLHKEFSAVHARLFGVLKALKSERQEVKGVLRIGAYLEFAKSKLTPILKSFIAEFPDVQIKMSFETPTRLNAMLMEGQLDVCFSIFPARDRKAVLSRSVYQEELVLVAARHLLANQPTFADVMKQPMIEYYFNHTPIRQWLALHYQKKPKKIPARVYAATAEMVLSLVKEKAGIGIVPAYLVTGTEMQNAVKVIRPTPKRLVDHIWLLEKINTEKPPALSEFKKRVFASPSLN